VDALIPLIRPALPPDASKESPPTGMLQPFHSIGFDQGRKVSTDTPIPPNQLKPF
jgi:hypothetical protein